MSNKQQIRALPAELALVKLCILAGVRALIHSNPTFKMCLYNMVLIGEKKPESSPAVQQSSAPVNSNTPICSPKVLECSQYNGCLDYR